MTGIPRGRSFRRQELAELLGQVHQDRAGLEDPDRLRAAAIDKRRDLGIRIDRDKAAAELVALADLDQPGIVLRALMAAGQQLFEHDRDLDAVRRAQRVELQRMAADRQLLLVLGARGRAVDVGEPASAGLATQTLGGVYSGVSVIREAPGVIGGARTPRASPHLTRQVGRRARVVRLIWRWLTGPSESGRSSSRTSCAWT